MFTLHKMTQFADALNFVYKSRFHSATVFLTRTALRHAMPMPRLAVSVTGTFSLSVRCRCLSRAQTYPICVSNGIFPWVGQLHEHQTNKVWVKANFNKERACVLELTSHAPDP